MARQDYGPLREAHRQALEAQTAREPEQDHEPTRPEGHPQQGHGWTDQGGMAQQQDSANVWFKAAQERRTAQHEVEQGRDEGQSQPEAPAQQRTLKFFEDREPSRSQDELKGDPAGRDSGASKEQDGGRTLSFAEDRGQEQGHER